MNTHTPGPWEVDEGDGMPIAKVSFRVVTAPCTPNIGSGLSREEITANARLIAAAPDLLAACKELVVAVSAAMRVIADLDAMKYVGAPAETREQRLVDELKISGVVNGFGVRANAAIAKAVGGIIT